MISLAHTCRKFYLLMAMLCVLAMPCTPDLSLFSLPAISARKSSPVGEVALFQILQGIWGRDDSSPFGPEWRVLVRLLFFSGSVWLTGRKSGRARFFTMLANLRVSRVISRFSVRGGNGVN